jgi:hypothetical protein
MQNNRPAYMNQQPQMIQTGPAPHQVQQQTGMNYSPHIMQQQQQQPPPQQQQQQQPQSQQQQQQQRVQHLNQVTTTGKPVPGTNVHPHCIRSGCPNAAISSPDWENEYCSNECVVSHCRYKNKPLYLTFN